VTAFATKCPESCEFFANAQFVCVNTFVRAVGKGRGLWRKEEREKEREVGRWLDPGIALIFINANIKMVLIGNLKPNESCREMEMRAK